MIILQITICFIVIIAADILVYRLFSLKLLEYMRMMSVKSAFVGENVSMIEIIHNKSIIPFPCVLLQTGISDGLKFKQLENMHVSGEKHRSIFSLMPFSKVKRVHSIKCVKRGEYRFSNISLTSSDILGFLTKSYDVNCDTGILVYPQPLSRDKITMPYHSLQGDIVVRRFILPDPFMFAGVREYNNEDPMNTVSWKATARTGTLQVHKKDFTTNLRVTLVLNVDIKPYASKYLSAEEQSILEYLISYCAAMADYATEQGIEIGFISNGHFGDETVPVYIEPHYGSEQYYEILGALARLQNDSVSSVSSLLTESMELFANTEVVIVSAWNDVKLDEAADYLKSCGFDAVLITPDYEETIAPKAVEKHG